MARFVRRREGDPLMRLERPSSASVQTTAHIITACFNEVLSERPMLDNAAVYNLAVSRKGSGDYHDHYVSELKRVIDEYSGCLEELASLERHLVQARARALAEDECAFSVLSDSCPSLNSISLPKGPSKLRTFLDEELLGQHCLLTPSQYLPPPPDQADPPHGGEPSYLKPTFTSTQHAAIPSSLRQIATTNKTSDKQTKPLWREVLPAEDREQEKAALTQLSARVGYLQSSKHSPSPFSHTASAGRLRMASKQDSQHKCPQFFSADPKELIFSDYQPGQTYEAVVEFRNVSGASRQLRVVPLSSAFFSVSPTYFPDGSGLIAPGMHCAYTVKFTPDSLANYQHQLKVLSHCGECLVVPLRAARPAPQLSLPSVLECGHCLVGSRRRLSLQCSNSGGEGSFRLLPLPLQEDEAQPSPTLHIGAFSITPTQFHLPPGSTLEFTVTFDPCEVREYSSQLQIACDNGEVQPLTLTGVGEQVCVGCVFTGPTSPSETITFASGPAHSLRPTTSPCHLQYWDIIETPHVQFDTANPYNKNFKTVVIRNFSRVDLAYSWRLYRPLTEPPSPSSLPGDPLRGGNVPLAERPLESLRTPFTVRPQLGTLPAGEATSFVFCFKPEEEGVFQDMAYLVLSGVPHTNLDSQAEGCSWQRVGEEEVAVVCVQLEGGAEAYSLELRPPLLLLPGRLPLGTETRRRVKLTNHSLSSVTFHWPPSDCTVGVTVQPPSGNIVSGGSVWCEVVVGGRKEGRFSTQLSCEVDHCPHPFLLPVQGRVKPPMVTLDCARVNLGLIALGSSTWQVVTVRNREPCTMTFHLREQPGVSAPCLSFSPARGELPPHGCTRVRVECLPRNTGQLQPVIECLVNHTPVRCVAVCVEVQRPEVYLGVCRVEVEKGWVGVGVERQVTLHNSTLIATQFMWSSQRAGASGEHCRLQVSPAAGRIGPRESVTVTMVTTWTREGSHHAVACCHVLGMEHPLPLSLHAAISRLTVEYHLEGERPELDFGQGNRLRSPHTLSLTVTNTSAIPTSLSACVRHFPSAPPPTPPLLPLPVSKSVGARGRLLLPQTQHIGDPRSRTEKQTSEALASALLREGRGCCFVVEPERTSLPPFESRTLSITAHSDMWGQYQDELLCQVDGLEQRTIPIRCGVSGCPIVFQTTASSAHTLTRFGCHPPNAKAVSRSLKLHNTSPVALRVDWQVFNLIPEDGKLLDLISWIGEPFPCEGESEEEEDGALVRVQLRPHEGEPSFQPFSIFPRQLVVPARGEAMVRVTFQPSVQALREVGEAPVSYALGYLSLDSQSPPHVSRLTGYDINPLRIDITAGINQPRLSLECDEDDGVDFLYPASILLSGNKVCRRAQRSHPLTLVNPSASVLSLRLSCDSRHFSISTHSQDWLQLPPHNSISFSLTFTLCQEEVQAAGQTGNDLTFSDHLRVEFSTGAEQVFPVTARVVLPALSLSTTHATFETCILGTPASAAVTIANRTSSTALWRTCVSSGLEGVVAVSPESGVLPADMTEGRPSTHLTFTPREECVYSGAVTVEEELTGRVWTIAVSGRGSADERFSQSH